MYYYGNMYNWNQQFNHLYYIQNRIMDIEKTQGNMDFASYIGYRGSSELYRYSFTKQKYDAKWYANKESEVSLLYDAYETIQDIRQQITGQEIKYRLYTSLGRKSDRHIGYIEIKGDQLHNFITQEASALRINESAVRKAIRQKENEMKIIKAGMSSTRRLYEDTRYYKSIQAINKIYNGLKDANILQTVKDLEYTYTKPDLTKGTGKMSGVIFHGKNGDIKTNQGEVIETIDKMVFDGKGRLNKDFYRYGIDKFVNHSISRFSIEKDTISGFKQGDNGLYQIKANKAQLMEYSTIMNAIQDVLSIKERILGDQAYDIARQELIDMFSGEGKMSISKQRARQMIDEIARNEIAESMNGSKSSSNSHGDDLSYGGRIGDYL